MSVLNTAHRNTIVAATGAAFNGGRVRIYTGSPPGPNVAATGTMLVDITVPATAFGSPSNGAVAKAGTWSGTAVASGAPGYFRLESTGGTEVREGSAGTGGTVMILSGLVGGEIVNGGTVTVTAYTITQPSGA
jgi:hypothetical protein